MIDGFMRDEVLPLEPYFLDEPFAELLPRLEEKRRAVKQMGLWAPNHPEEYGGMGLGLVDHGLVSEALGVSPLGHYVFGCHAPDAGNIEILHQHGTEEQKQRWLGAAGGGRDPQLLLDDRARDAGLEPGDDGDHRRRRRRRLRHQRPEVVHHRRRRRRPGGGHGGHRPRGAAPPARQHDPGAHRHPGLRPGAQHQGHGPRRRGRLQPRRDPLPLLPGAARQPAGRRGRTASSSPRSGSARAASTTACAGWASASGRST